MNCLYAKSTNCSICQIRKWIDIAATIDQINFSSKVETHLSTEQYVDLYSMFCQLDLTHFNSLKIQPPTDEDIEKYKDLHIILNLHSKKIIPLNGRRGLLTPKQPVDRYDNLEDPLA